MDIEQIRNDFEEWMSDGYENPRAVERNSKGDYILMQAASAWHVWKAAHAQYNKPAAPVVWPEPITHMNVSRGGFIATLQDEGPYVFPVYSQAQVRAMLEAQGAKCG